VDFERSGQFPATRDVAHWRWIGWREASAQLAERTLHNLVEAPVMTERQHANCP
jgi:hypothetical protein